MAQARGCPSLSKSSFPVRPMALMALSVQSRCEDHSGPHSTQHRGGSQGHDFPFLGHAAFQTHLPQED